MDLMSFNKLWAWVFAQETAFVVLFLWIIKEVYINRALRRELTDANLRLFKLAGTMSSVNETLRNIHSTVQHYMFNGK